MDLRPNKPKAVVAVSIMPPTLDTVGEHWEEASLLDPDLIEWRLDALDPQTPGGLDSQRISSLGEELRDKYGLPVIATLRTSQEGGGFSGSPAQYRSAVEAAALWADFVDIELGHPGSARLVRELRDQVAVVGSFHDFNASPSAGITKQLLEHMEELGCAVAKVAWMVKNEADLQVVQQLQTWAAQDIQIPCVIIGMGPLGTASRLGDSARLSAFTFARGVTESAPGQPTVQEVRAS